MKSLLVALLLLATNANSVEVFDNVFVLIFAPAEVQACQRGGGCLPITKQHYQDLVKAAQACKASST